MPLKEDFEKQGNWLFQRRSWLPVLLYPFALAVMYFHCESVHRCVTSETWGLVCFLVSLAGLAVRAVTIGFAPQGTSGRNTAGQVADTLNQTDIYSTVRHPLYLGNFLMWLGLFLFVGIWWFVLICSLLYWLYYERIMFAEEEFLRRKYVSQYEHWASRTPAFLPRFSSWKASCLPFSFRNVLKREAHGLFAVIVCFALLNAFSYFLMERRFVVDFHWQITFALGAILFLTLRTLRKKTTVLDVAGR